MAPTAVKFPLNPSGQIVSYNYTVDYSPMKGIDVLGEFVKSCEKRQIRTGFYYSVVSNTYLNVESGLVSYTIFLFFQNLSSYDTNIKVQNHTLQPGQLNITQETYDSIVLQQLRELWTNYDSLNEIWFDGGLVIQQF
jgi:alpha-L-fucosidase